METHFSHWAFLSETEQGLLGAGTFRQSSMKSGLGKRE